MTKSDQIRTLAGEGLSVAEIARRLGIRYQHAYGVLKRSQPLSGTRSVAMRPGPTRASALPQRKPSLQIGVLIEGGFQLSARWQLSPAGELVIDQKLPKEPGVYGFAKDGVVLYVGVATMGLAKRLYFYAKPGVTQRTSQRLNGILKEELQLVPSIDVYTAVPPDLEWNGLPVHGCAGLELGLIKKYALPWNKRSAG